MSQQENTTVMSQVDWRALGCKMARRVEGRRGARGRAAWRLRAPRRSREDWNITAAHCPYLGEHPYKLGNDAWRISIQWHDAWSNRDTEVAHLVTTSEAEAFASVAWLDAVARASDYGESERA